MPSGADLWYSEAEPLRRSPPLSGETVIRQSLSMSLFVTLLILAASAVGALLGFGEPSSAKRRAGQALVGAIFLLSAYQAWLGYTHDQREAHVASGAGVVGQDRLRGDAYRVLAGGNYFSESSFDAVFGIPMHLSTSEDGRLLISYDLRDASGEVLGRIRDNEWFDVAGKLDRNFDDQAFEIYDPGSSKAVLQIARDGNVAIIQGHLRTSDGRMVTVTQSEIIGGYRPLCAWFEYPSELHPAERDTICLPPDIRFAIPDVLSP